MDKFFFFPHPITENGYTMFLWIGQKVAPDLIQSIFAVQSAAQIDIDKVTFSHLNCEC